MNVPVKGIVYKSLKLKKNNDNRIKCMKFLKNNDKQKNKYIRKFKRNNKDIDEKKDEVSEH